jgi:hypothetical protein
VIPAGALRPGNRVWQFQPDDSVLDPPGKNDKDSPPLAQSKAESGEAKSSPADRDDVDPDKGTDRGTDDSRPELSEEQLAQQQADKEFASQWRGGRLTVRSSITPVDALTVQKPRATIVDRFAPRPDRSERMWVCEDPGRTIQDGSFVVTSQLGLVASDSVSVRVKTEMLEGDAANDESQPQQEGAATAAAAALTDVADREAPQ